MATIKKYQDKDGNTRYQFQVYLGVDPLTGKRKIHDAVDSRQKKKPRLYYQDLNLMFISMGYQLKTIIQFLKIFTSCGSHNINKQLRKALG